MVARNVLLACASLLALHPGLAAQSAPLRLDPESPEARAQEAATIDFNRDVRPILAGHCFACHGPDAARRKGGPKGAGGLRLDSAGGSRMDLGEGRVAVREGRPEESELIRRITAAGRDRMPPRSEGDGLDQTDIDVLRRWIEQGGRYARHWSFVAPRRPPVPPAPDPAWVRNPIDAFVAGRHQREGLGPAPPADRTTLLRRVAFDLTGLPPDPQEQVLFLDDHSPGSYEELVDRLLASPAYGEHLARHWLDLARYADSAGYADDPKRTVWAYRDWVIRAFDRNLPFDRFTMLQLAGDLLPDPTDDQLVATAFHRNTMTNSEGGTDDEEFRNVAVVDRVNTTMAVWMGTTVMCAQCHDHKYDPISQREFFELFAFFNTTEDSDKMDERPTLALYTEQQKSDRARWTGELAQREAELQRDTPEVRASFARWDAGFPRDATWHPVFPVPWHGGLHRLVTWLPSVVALRGDLRQKQPPRLTLVPEGRPAPRARFLRISLPGEKRILSLAEVQVFGGGENLARKGAAQQSSTDYQGPARLAIDGNTDGHFTRAGSTTHTATSDDPWWEVDLGAEHPIDRVVVWNRTDNRSIGERLRGFRIELFAAPAGGTPRRPVFTAEPDTLPAPRLEVSTSGARSVPVAGSYPDRIGGQPATTFVLGAETRVDDGALLLSGPASQPRRPGVFQATADPRFARYAAVPGPVLAALATPAAQRTAEQRTRLREHHRRIAPELAPLRDRIAGLKKDLAGIRPVTTVPIMREQTGDRRTTHVHIRGNFLAQGEAVTCGVPAAFHPLPEDRPRDRLALARWLVSPQNPLTARVVVNRFWELLFGRGLVATSEDFGVRGALPSHPELLDWLATEFVASGWDVKRLLKLIVTSATYRQSSAASPELRGRDPDNELLARGPRFRLSAEMIRDQALALSGLLSPRRFGPPVRPPRPNLGLRAAFGGSTDWQDSIGEDRYRRGLYTFWQRSLPYPSMAVFDAPSREVCTVRRVPTNTPLQALVLLNDPVYVEAAQALARRIVADGGSTAAERAAFALRRCLARPGTEAEIDRLVRLVTGARARYRDQPAAAEAMATRPLGPLPPGADAAELAAWTVAANVLLNLDEVLVKR